MINELEISVQSQKLVIRKTSLNQFIPINVHYSEICELKKKSHDKKKITIFFHSLQN